MQYCCSEVFTQVHIAWVKIFPSEVNEYQVYLFPFLSAMYVSFYNPSWPFLWRVRSYKLQHAALWQQDDCKTRVKLIWVFLQAVISQTRHGCIQVQTVQKTTCSLLIVGEYGVCLAVHQWYRQPTRCNNNGLFNNSNRLNMFRAIISPIFRSTRLCLQLVV